MFANAPPPQKQHIHRTISYFSYIHFLSLVHSVYYNMILIIILISLFLVISSIIIVFNNNTVIISNSLIDIGL